MTGSGVRLSTSTWAWPPNGLPRPTGSAARRRTSLPAPAIRRRSPRWMRASLRAEIAAVPLPQRKGPRRCRDGQESPRDTCLDVLRTLKPAFKDAGTVTAGNARHYRRSGRAGRGTPIRRRGAGVDAAGTHHSLCPGCGQAARTIHGAHLPRPQGSERLGVTPADFDLIEINGGDPWLSSSGPAPTRMPVSGFLNFQIRYYLIFRKSMP